MPFRVLKGQISPRRSQRHSLGARHDGHGNWELGPRIVVAFALIPGQ